MNKSAFIISISAGAIIALCLDSICQPLSFRTA